MSSIKGRCETTCNYYHTYTSCNCTVECPSGGTYLLLCKNSSCSQQASLNSKIYTLKSVRIYKPSLHQFSGVSAAAGIILSHQAAGGEYLLVCLPVKQGSSTTTWFDFLKGMASWQCNGTQSINTAGNWSLEDILPDQKTTKYYYYDADTLPFGPDICQDLRSEINVVHYVVYDMDDAAIISSENFNILNTILSGKGNKLGHGISIEPGNQPVHVVEPAAAAPGTDASDYYWNCQVADDNEEKPTITQSAETESIFMWVLLSVIILLFILAVWNYGISTIAKGTIGTLGSGAAAAAEASKKVLFKTGKLAHGAVAGAAGLLTRARKAPGVALSVPPSKK